MIVGHWKQLKDVINEEIELIKLQAMLEATDRIFKALSDGYNHSYVGMNFGPTSILKEADYLIWDIHIPRTDDEYIAYINEAKTEITNPEQRIEENLLWSIHHLKTFNSVPEIFSNQYNYEFLDKFIKEITSRLKNLISKWDYNACELDVYCGERRVLIIKGSEKTMILDVLNNLH